MRRSALTAVVLGLALLVFAAFSPALRNGFVSHDDDTYIVGNPRVRAGLTIAGLRWAFTANHANNWHPLTWISLMLDVSIFGLNPGGHHLAGMLLHGATAILVFFVLRALSGALWPAAIAAALFALHPLRVESVAWAAERKDLLSGFFWMLTVGAYLRYVRRPAPRRLVPVTALLAAGLLAKPMAVTLPFALLILDWWPLERMRLGRDPGAGRSWGRLFREKLPLVLVSALMAAVTLRVQSLGGATAGLSFLSCGARLSNAAVAYARYLELTFWPVRLSVFYPHPEAPWPLTVSSTALAFLAAIALLAIRVRRRAPAIGAGYLWFLGTLVPVIGLVQVGYQAMADRYTYVPSIGVSVALVWGVRQFAQSRTVRRVLTAGAVAAVLLLTFQTRQQVRYWRDDRALFGRALELDGDNWLAHASYGVALGKEERFEEALAHYRQSLESRPLNVQALTNLGVALQRLGRPEEGTRTLRDALALAPDFAAARYNLGLALSDAGRREEALAHLLAAASLQPSNAKAFNALGVVLSSLGRPVEGIERLATALAIDPDFAEARYNLAVALYQRGQPDEAEAYLLAVVRQDPGHRDALYNLGVIAAGKGRAAAAEGFFRRALAVDPGMTLAHLNLGVVLVRLGRFDEAERRFREVLHLEPDNNEAQHNLTGLLSSRAGR